MKKVSSDQTARNYAQALYEAAKKENKLDEVHEDSEHLAEAFKNISSLKFLSNPAWTNIQKKDLTAQVSKALNLSEPSANFLELTALNGKISLLQKILVQFKHIFYREQGIMEVTVESAKEFSASQEKKLFSGLKKLLKQKFVVNYKINPQLLGGLVIQYGSVRIDDSIAGKLKRLEEVMKGNV